ncbi:uncharacterized protein DUF2752 [Breznakia blatticola]|uniref:Uncharacterized protein DUF2752 n=1 Tax=Breznakia blatticola TaxID=1754012 RepID=A0A4R8ACY4_9FIRM|nr:DUF2752 domain-containing protein [Breznakia blatticola]TDW26393.1 uncharacterized protein DUF2752 [Breznakia blatticola]
MQHKIKDILLIGLGLMIAFFILGYYCPISTVIGIPCPGCGMTRAMIQLLQFNIEDALYFHPLCIIFVFYTLWMMILFIKHRSFYNNGAKYTTWILIIVFIVTYSIRMITIFPNEPMPFSKQAFIPKIISTLQK